MEGRSEIIAAAHSARRRSIMSGWLNIRKERGDWMPVLDWTPDLEIGIYEIDLQHRSLVSMANQLHDAIERDKGAQTIDWILEELLLYTKMHFATEEKYMQRYEHEESAQHKLQHGELLKAMKRFKRKMSAGDDVANELMLFLQQWLGTHITGSDRDLGKAYLAGNRTR